MFQLCREAFLTASMDNLPRWACWHKIIDNSCLKIDFTITIPYNYYQHSKNRFSAAMCIRFMEGQIFPDWHIHPSTFKETFFNVFI